MEIKYEVNYIENSQGTGTERPYVRLFTHKAKSLEEMARMIEQSSTVTAADFKAVMSEFCHFAISELASGNRVYVPEIGYLSLSVTNVPPAKIPNGTITGKEIFLRSINFQPESKFLDGVRRNVSFKKSELTTRSARYAEDDIYQKTEAYLKENEYVTRRIMRERFGLSDHAAKRWLDRFVATGKLEKTEIGRQQIYRLTV